ncbi:MAG TPA: V-type ATPase 116kDa subunit family protein [Nitrososphaera sp.]|nr:V-type ATPase 116kDa subunit family protein [Nitrososphaera sp.]
MGLAKLMKATIVLPRVDTQEVVSRLAELEWFHPIQTPSDHPNPYLDDLLLKAQRLFQEIDEVIKELGVPLETGVMATMFKGAPKGKTDYFIENIQNFIADLEDKSAAILDNPKKVIAERNKVAKELEEYGNLKDALEMAAKVNLDLTLFGKFKYFFSGLFVIDSADEVETRRTLGDLPIYTSKLSEQKLSMVVFGAADDSDRITKTLRSFGVHPLQIPAKMPQNPSVAYAQADAKVKELEAKQAEIEKNIEKLKETLLTKVLSLHEAARVAKDVLETTRKPGGTRNFAVIQGYIPDQMEKKFRSMTKDYVSVVEDVHIHGDKHGGGGEEEILPTLLTNKSYTRTFEVITETQGIPRYGEVDPTPIIAFVWPLFYGLMFADFGHGILLFGLGMLFRYRGNGSLRTWGTLIAASGAAAALAGLGTGEMFGFHFEEIAILAPIFEPLGFVGLLNVSELTFERVVMILEVSIAIGIVHLLMAYFLRLRADFKQGNKLMVLYHDIPTILQYFAVVSLILAAIGSGYDIIGMFGITGVTHTEPVPWLTVVFGDWVTVDLVAKTAPLVIIATVVIMIIGGIKEEKHLKAQGRDEGGGLVGIIVEVIMVRIIEMLSNTISYSRLGIMLLVHAALLVTVNDSFEHGGGYAVLIGGNIGIMLIEGLIVYIQTIRLHLYEWFPKWYVGEGTEFKKIVPKMLYSNFVWKDSKVPPVQAKQVPVQAKK